MPFKDIESADLSFEEECFLDIVVEISRMVTLEYILKEVVDEILTSTSLKNDDFSCV